MAAIQIKDVPKEFLHSLKLAAAQRGVTLKYFVIVSLTEAIVKTLPPAPARGTEPGKRKS